MTDGYGHIGNGSSDEALLAYLHGQLSGTEADAMRDAIAADDELRERADELQRGGEEIAQAFAVMLEDAPEERLAAMLAEIDQPEATPAVPLTAANDSSWSGGMRLLAAAVALLIAFGGGVTSSFLFTPEPAPPPKKMMASPAVQLRDAVSHYMALYSKTTLEMMPSNAKMQTRSLKAASDALGLSLSKKQVRLKSAKLKGARILTFEDKPLIQIGYLYNGETPLAICITKAKEPAHDLKTETRWRQNMAYWSDDEYVYVVLGKLPQDTINDIAKTFAKRFR